MNRRSCLALILVLLATPVLAADGPGAAGKWNASLSTAQGPFTMVFEFAVNGAKLTGTLSNFMGSTPITNGVIAGNNLSFKVSLPGRPNGGGPTVIAYKGVVKGDELALTSKVESMPIRPGATAPQEPKEQTLAATRAK